MVVNIRRLDWVLNKQWSSIMANAGGVRMRMAVA